MSIGARRRSLRAYIVRIARSPSSTSSVSRMVAPTEPDISRFRGTTCRRAGPAGHAALSWTFPQLWDFDPVVFSYIYTALGRYALGMIAFCAGLMWLWWWCFDYVPTRDLTRLVLSVYLPLCSAHMSRHLCHQHAAGGESKQPAHSYFPFLPTSTTRFPGFSISFPFP